MNDIPWVSRDITGPEEWSQYAEKILRDTDNADIQPSYGDIAGMLECSCPSPEHHEESRALSSPLLPCWFVDPTVKYQFGILSCLKHVRPSEEVWRRLLKPACVELFVVFPSLVTIEGDEDIRRACYFVFKGLDPSNEAARLFLFILDLANLLRLWDWKLSTQEMLRLLTSEWALLEDKHDVKMGALFLLRRPKFQNNFSPASLQSGRWYMFARRLDSKTRNCVGGFFMPCPSEANSWIGILVPDMFDRITRVPRLDATVQRLASFQKSNFKVHEIAKASIFISNNSIRRDETNNIKKTVFYVMGLMLHRDACGKGLAPKLDNKVKMIPFKMVLPNANFIDCTIVLNFVFMTGHQFLPVIQHISQKLDWIFRYNFTIEEEKEGPVPKEWIFQEEHFREEKFDRFKINTKFAGAREESHLPRVNRIWSKTTGMEDQTIDEIARTVGHIGCHFYVFVTDDVEDVLTDGLAPPRPFPMFSKSHYNHALQNRNHKVLMWTGSLFITMEEHETPFGLSGWLIHEDGNFKNPKYWQTFFQSIHPQTLVFKGGITEFVVQDLIKNSTMFSFSIAPIWAREGSDLGHGCFIDIFRQTIRAIFGDGRKHQYALVVNIPGKEARSGILLRDESGIGCRFYVPNDSKWTQRHFVSFNIPLSTRPLKSKISGSTSFKPNKKCYILGTFKAVLDFHIEVCDIPIYMCYKKKREFEIFVDIQKNEARRLWEDFDEREQFRRIMKQTKKDKPPKKSKPCNGVMYPGMLELFHEEKSKVLANMGNNESDDSCTLEALYQAQEHVRCFAPASSPAEPKIDSDSEIQQKENSVPDSSCPTEFAGKDPPTSSSPNKKSDPKTTEEKPATLISENQREVSISASQETVDQGFPSPLLKPMESIFQHIVSPEARNNVLDEMIHLTWKKLVDNEEPLRVCDNCGREEFDMKVCYTCRASFFCNNKCFKRAQKTHKKMCAQIVNQRLNIVMEVLRQPQLPKL
ncbi:hypothetical protein TCAL_10909 [Tigriopus californicus]|uniref:MYND-type domain-containing protein n=1 Tax=Tigriopus californicus TaxID=6832 RepID=A0A553PJT5_TIGCA|nr:hypothetical protein TCAL_10909 [Tigriopus californicus]|eukprot:TCALIF_10909-PA protein Name:"Protein of unknown function" AED:0.52 eAED:0.87 QI:0/0/0/0.75/1/1/4/0/978